MKITQLTSEEIAQLRVRANTARQTMMDLYEEGKSGEALNMCAQATRIEVWIDVQEGRSEWLRERMEREDYNPTHKPKTTYQQPTTITTRQYHLKGVKTELHPQVRKAWDSIHAMGRGRGKEERTNYKQMPALKT